MQAGAPCPAVVREAEEQALEASALVTAYRLIWNRMWRLRARLRKQSPASLTLVEKAFLRPTGELMTPERLEAYQHCLPEDDPVRAQIPRIMEHVDDMARAGRLSRPGRAPKSAETKAWQCGRVVFLTYNGEWGIFTGEVDCNGDVDYVAEKVAAHPRFRQLAADMQELMVGLNQLTYFPMIWAYCFEICPEPLARGIVRIHAHVACTSDEHKSARRAHNSIYYPPKFRWAFHGSLPLQSHYHAGLVHARNSVVQSFFYILVRKKGSVYRRSNRRLYDDMIVKPEWAFQLLQQGKITIATARDILVRVARNVPRNLRDLEGYAQQVATQNEADALDEAHDSLSLSAKPFKVLPVVEQWRRAYMTPARRYKFLVLEGPSMLGKTAFAESLAGFGRTLNIDCASAPEPDLREYISQDHEVVIFDEAKASLVLRCKRLFQAPACRVHLGQSNTNCHAYTVMVWRKKFIVCSNTWTSDLAACAVDDRAWLEANSVHIRVTERLWRDL